MRLLVSCIPYDRGKSGISVYVRETVRALREQGHELTLLVEPGDGETFESMFGGTADSADSESGVHPCQITEAPRWTKRPAFSMLWHLFMLPRWIKRHRRDFDGFVICAANRRVCSRYPLPTTATVHDLANFHIPGKYSRLRMFYLAHVLPHYAKKAHRLVAVSGATKADMLKFWHCRDSHVTVLYNGLPSNCPQTRIVHNCPKEKFSILNSQFSILYISRIEHPGKNHVRLIEAYGKLPREIAEAHPLVLAGADWKDAEVVHDAAWRSPHSDLITFTGFVPDADMEKLWGDAGYYVFPSLFEGFGLSLIEAMARGIPCASSNNGSLGEIAADAAITFNPENVDDIAIALCRLLGESAEERAARVERGFAQAAKFSWEDHAKGIVNLIATMPPARIFGIPIARICEVEAVERVIAFAKVQGEGTGDGVIPPPGCAVLPLSQGESSDWESRHLGGGDRERRPAFVATLNVDFVSNAVRGWPFGGNDELWGYLKNADLVTADGMPIVLLSKLLRRALPERVTGADMVPAICRRAAEEGLSVYVLGGDKDAVAAAFKKLGISNLKVAGVDPAFVKLDEDQPEIAERISAANPDILFVALGNPKQELWMGRNASRLRAGVMIGIGGTFNFIAGRVKRAPRWMQKCGLEWIYRILQEPGRLWRRYAYGLVKFSWLSLIHVCGGYRR